MNSVRAWAIVLCPAVLCAAATAADVVPIDDQSWHGYEWRASTFVPGAQHEAALDVGPEGQMVTVWSSRRQQEGRSGVYLQRFDPDGVAVGSETAVGLSRGIHQTAPGVAIDGLGNTWVVWQSHNQDGHAGGIFARYFDPSFVGGPEICVNQQWRGHQSKPVVAASADGTAVILWTSQLPGASRPRLHARLFGVGGGPLTDEFRVSEVENRAELVASAAFARDGSFAIAFSAFDQHMEPAGIRLQRFDPRGGRLGDELLVSGPPKASQVEPVIAATRDGYVVAWHDGESDGDDYGVLARRLDAEGNPLCDPFVVNTTWRGSQSGAAVAVAPDGRFAIAWNSDDGDGTGVFAQLFAADGTRLGGEFRINRHTEGNQALHAASGSRRLVFGHRDELICVWNGNSGLGGRSSVNVTMLSPRALALDSRLQGVTADMPPAGPVLAQADGPGPHIPPTFDPRMIDRAEREIRRDDDFGFTAIVNTGWTPPDPHVAVGPDHIGVMTNGAIAFFEKDGTLLFQEKIEGGDGFWGGLGATGFVFDPEILYDELSGRFFAMAAEAYAPGSKSYALVAVAASPDPLGAWHKYRFETTAYAGNLFDSPNIGVDENVVYVTGDGFGHGANYPVYTFDKASLLAGQPPAIQKSLTLPTSTQSAGIPPVSFDNPPGLYMMEHGEASNNNTIRLITLMDPLGSPYFETYTLYLPAGAEYGPPGLPSQKGTSTKPQTFDARFWSVAYRNGSLWGTHHINSNPVKARWYEIAMNGWPVSGYVPELVQWGQLDLGPGIHTFFSSIGVNERGDAALCAARSSSQEYISMITTYRLHSDPLGTMRPTVIQKVSTGPYGQPRWGDYSAVQPEPGSNRTFWAHHEYAEGNSWRTWITRLDLPGLLGDMNCDGVVDGFDIHPFVLALTDPDEYALQYPDCDITNADVNEDGIIDGFDIQPFVELLTG